jgi:hypothetical protein
MRPFLLALLLLASTQAFAQPAPEPIAQPAPQPIAQPAPQPIAQPAPEPIEPGGYGRKGSMHLGLSLGVGSGTGGMRYAGGAELGYFFLNGVAPGIDVRVSGGSGVLTTGMFTGTVRLVPVRTGSLAFFLIGRAGRLLIASHADAWAAGGGAGVVIATGSNLGFVISYEIIGLLPKGSCSDLANGCRLDAFGLGLVMGL